jgi:diguanylate cyclase (GGDEF)-like protein
MDDALLIFAENRAPEREAAETPREERLSRPSAIGPEGLDVACVLARVGEIAYEWDIATDRLCWSGDLDAILGLDGAEVSTGRDLATLLDAQSPGSRYDAVMNAAARDQGTGVAFSVQYCLCAPGQEGARLWLEDSGRWYADEAGRPALAHGVVRVINERHAREERLAFLSRYDELTGQFNRVHLLELLQDALDCANRHRAAGAFFLLAVDNLSEINETYGFAVADEVLSTVARRLKTALRGGDALGRYSGAKLGAVLNNCDEEAMRIAARRLRAAVRDAVVETSAGHVSATLSIGGVSFPRHGRTLHEILAQAQEALDEARGSGTGSYSAYNPSRLREQNRNLNKRLADEIVAALKQDRLTLALQPIVRAGDRVPEFHEALLRLRRPDGGLESAERLIPAAEKLGFIRHVDRRVLDLALSTLEADPQLTLSLNVSAATTEDPEWIAEMVKRMRGIGDLARRIIVEITETTAIHDIATSTHFVAGLRDHGVRVAIDDFGAGYTSFRNLKLLDVDIVKIDGSFIERISEDPVDQIFVRSLIDLARNLGITTVAEWVRDEEDASLLTSFGVDYLQGFIFGQPRLVAPAAQA